MRKVASAVPRRPARRAGGRAGVHAGLSVRQPQRSALDEAAHDPSGGRWPDPGARHAHRRQQPLERALRTVRARARENELYRAMLDALPDFIFAKDREARFIAANTATARIMGCRGGCRPDRPPRPRVLSAGDRGRVRGRRGEFLRAPRDDDRGAAGPPPGRHAGLAVLAQGAAPGQKRADHRLCRPRPGHHRREARSRGPGRCSPPSRAAGRGIAHHDRGGRAGEPEQVGIPGGHEPRDPHADDGRARDGGPAGDGEPRCPAAALCRRDPALRPASAPHHQLDPGFLADRGRQGRAGADRLRARGRARARPLDHGAAGDGTWPGPAPRAGARQDRSWFAATRRG